jgi:hypothetical protein
MAWDPLGDQVVSGGVLAETARSPEGRPRLFKREEVEEVGGAVSGVELIGGVGD